MRLTISYFLIPVFCFFLFSCEQNNDLPEEAPGSLFPVGKEVNVNLQISPALENEEQPLERAVGITDPGLYAINVFWKSQNANSSYLPYASGLFDNTSNINIGLIEGYTYRFDCSYLAENELPFHQEWNDTIYYGLPFSQSSKGFVDGRVNNKLVISISPLSENTSFYQHLYKGRTQIKADSISTHPNVKRFYGSSTLDFRVANDPYPHLSIQLKRAYYSLQFKTEDIAEGDSVRIESTDIAPFLLLHSPNNVSESDIRLISMNEISNYYSGAINPTENIPLSIYFRGSGDEEWRSIIKQTITVQRNKKNVIRIVNINRYISNADISFEDDSTLEEEGQEIGK